MDCQRLLFRRPAGVKSADHIRRDRDRGPVAAHVDNLNGQSRHVQRLIHQIVCFVTGAVDADRDGLRHAVGRDLHNGGLSRLICPGLPYAHIIDPGGKSGGLSHPADLAVGKILGPGVLHPGGGAGDLAVRAVEGAGSDPHKSAGSGGAAGLRDAPRDPLGFRRAVLPLIAALQGGDCRVRAGVNLPVSGEGITGPLVHAGQLRPRIHQAGDGFRNRNGGQRGIWIRTWVRIRRLYAAVGHRQRGSIRQGLAACHSISGKSDRQGIVALFSRRNTERIVGYVGVKIAKRILVNVVIFSVWIFTGDERCVPIHRDAHLGTIQGRESPVCAGCLHLKPRLLARGCGDRFIEELEICYQVFIPAGGSVRGCPIAAAVQLQRHAEVVAVWQQHKIAGTGVRGLNVRVSRNRQFHGLRVGGIQAIDGDLGGAGHLAADAQRLILSQDQEATAVKVSNVKIGNSLKLRKVQLCAGGKGNRPIIPETALRRQGKVPRVYGQTGDVRIGPGNLTATASVDHIRCRRTRSLHIGNFAPDRDGAGDGVVIRIRIRSFGGKRRIRCRVFLLSAAGIDGSQGGAAFAVFDIDLSTAIKFVGRGIRHAGPRRHTAHGKISRIDIAGTKGILILKIGLSTDIDDAHTAWTGDRKRLVVAVYQAAAEKVKGDICAFHIFQRQRMAVGYHRVSGVFIKRQSHVLKGHVRSQDNA